MVSDYKKVIKNNEVAVLYSNNYGSGWYTAHNKPELIYDPIIIDILNKQISKQERAEQICDYVKNKYKNEYVNTLGAINLSIEWIPKNTIFDITSYDGLESISIQGSIEDLLIA